MKVSEEIQARADKMAALAKAIRNIEETEVNGDGRRLINLLLVTYSGLTSALCSDISGYSSPKVGSKSAADTRLKIKKDWAYRRAWDEAVKIIHNES